MNKYLIQFEWLGIMPHDPAKKWQDWKEIEKETDDKTRKEAKKEFNQKRISLGLGPSNQWRHLNGFRVLKILEEKTDIKEEQI